MSVYKWLRYVLLVVLVIPLYCQQTVFKNLEARHSRSPKNRVMVDTPADLVLDDSAHKLIVKSRAQPLEVKYEDVREVIFDKRYNWCYFEYAVAGGGVRPYELEVPDASWEKALEKMKAVFGDRVLAPEPREGEKIDKSTLKDLEAKHSLKVDKNNRPMPELKPDKALVVAVCLPIAARYAGKGNQVKLHANDRVIAVNRMGTYSFAYLDPGEYMLVTQAENASGLRLKLEPGKDYYFLQDVYFGVWKGRTSLSLHSRKVVMYELSGAYYADWKRTN